MKALWLSRSLERARNSDSSSAKFRAYHYAPPLSLYKARLQQHMKALWSSKAHVQSVVQSWPLKVWFEQKSKLLYLLECGPFKLVPKVEKLVKNLQVGLPKND